MSLWGTLLFKQPHLCWPFFSCIQDRLIWRERTTVAKMFLSDCGEKCGWFSWLRIAVAVPTICGLCHPCSYGFGLNKPVGRKRHQDQPGNNFLSVVSALVPVYRLLSWFTALNSIHVDWWSGWISQINLFFLNFLYLCFPFHRNRNQSR